MRNAAPAAGRLPATIVPPPCLRRERVADRGFERLERERLREIRKRAEAGERRLGWKDADADHRDRRLLLSDDPGLLEARGRRGLEQKEIARRRRHIAAAEHERLVSEPVEKDDQQTPNVWIRFAEEDARHTASSSSPPHDVSRLAPR